MLLPAVLQPSDIMQRSLPTVTHQVFQHISSTFGVTHVIGLHLFNETTPVCTEMENMPFFALVCKCKKGTINTINNKLMLSNLQLLTGKYDFVIKS